MLTDSPTGTSRYGLSINQCHSWSQARPLQDLAAQKAVQVLREDPNAIRTYDSLDPSVQQVLFPHLWKDYKRLWESEHQYRSSYNSIPAADRAVWSAGFGQEAGTRDSAGDAQDTSEHVDDNSSSSDENDFHTRRDYFRSKWRLCADDEGWHKSRTDQTYKWGGNEVFTIANTQAGTVPLVVDGWPSHSNLPLQKHSRWAFEELISSQLLYYRLTAVFGFEQRTFGDYRHCWDIELISKDDDYSTLSLKDFVGYPEFEFVGTDIRETSCQALELLWWLVGEEVFHPYVDAPILAGRVGGDD
ncbi:hypothetical protein H2200_012189 [Cladophialophora chaetospira]|uniref:Uncharacterized protein n=1 Tax=Cladophialophora chaetospira TaxID=386627 RepID=A0AA39CCQ1_9EURO|nr:hypothetical protein H2200_012189 [Cladophialophora chaetospira]